MTMKPVVLMTQINGKREAQVLIDSGCDCYAAMDLRQAQRLRLQWEDERERPLMGFADGSTGVTVLGGVRVTLAMSGYSFLAIHPPSTISLLGLSRGCHKARTPLGIIVNLQHIDQQRPSAHRGKVLT